MTDDETSPHDDTTDNVPMLTVHGAMDRMIATFGYPAIRLALGLCVVWIASRVSSYVLVVCCCML